MFFLKIDCVECNFTVNSGGVSIICLFFIFFFVDNFIIGGERFESWISPLKIRGGSN